MGSFTHQDAAVDLFGTQEAGGWRRLVFPAFWLVYLAQTAAGVAAHSTGAAAVAGYALIGVFAATYLTALWAMRARRRWYPWLIAALGVLLVAEAFFAHEDAFVMAIFIAVLLTAAFVFDPRGRIALVGLVLLTAGAAAVPALIPSWDSGVVWSTLVTIPLVSLAMWAFFNIIRANGALREARAEVARLAAENERTRIARDLHDLLGHSLTTITVKAGLAHRLAERDPARAAAEIGEVEQLTRSALADVRAAVSGYREVSLAGELASAREVLRAAGIRAEAPPAVDVVDPEHAELFGWVVREGVTNVVRHSRASACVIAVGADWLQIEDDGRGGAGGEGTGLTGLRERVAAAGGTVRAGGGPGGWRLRVDMGASPA